MKRPTVSYRKFLTTGALAMLVLITGWTNRALSDEPETVHIKAVAGMQYDLVRFKVKPGQRIKLVLTNADDMSHNLVITKPNARLKVVEEAMALAEKGPAMDFIPESSDVLWSIPVIAPGQTQSVTFTAPEKEEILPFVCTFPGHGYSMFGAIYVTSGALPPVETDQRIPDTRTEKSSHPYALEPPYFYRIFMPDASPAAIAVRLSENLSYCWDAGSCQLLYAWEGGFVDNSIPWKGHRNAEAKIMGDIFYRADDGHPLRLGNADNIPKEVKYKGFRLVDGYPEFHYTIDGMAVYEIFRESEGGAKMIRTFRIPEVDTDIWLNIEAEGDYRISSSAGERRGVLLKLTKQEAKEFSVEITHKKRRI